MKNITKIVFACLMLLPIAFYSCVDADPEEVLPYDEHYKGSEDADMAMLGLYGQFMELAEQVVILNELKADLMDVTNQASSDLEEISLNIPSKDNKWVDVTKFYAVIQNANDILFNFNKMLAEDKMVEEEYNERYSDVAALRCWVYLQLGLLFGEVPYITEPIISLDDLDKYKDNTMSLDELIPELIRVMEATPSFPELKPYESSNLIQTIDGYSLARFFLDKRCLMGDLYLFNDEYEKAAEKYYDVLTATDDVSRLKLYNYTHTGTSAPSWFAIVYRDGKSDDTDAYWNTWAELFHSTTTNRYTGDEIIWCMTFNPDFAPEYPFTDLFYTGWQLKPSDYADEEVWGGETQKNGFPFDARGRSGGYKTLTGGLETINYIIKFGRSSLSQNWILYRAGMLHLRYAEAVNRAGYSKLAWALVNGGLGSQSPTAGDCPYRYRREDGTIYPGDSVYLTGNSPFDLHSAPYAFDGRRDANLGLAQPWRSNGGVRGRASLTNFPFSPNPADGAVIDYQEPNVNNKELIEYLEEKIIREAALELGFEGHRWGDLVRVARRKNKENPGSGDTFLWDENIKKKHERAGTQADMSSSDKWFLPLYF
ncbi:RagB/SusD family nutrient uptake outer membrane protein [Bacteroidales bacterium OttesenSCG-928-J19]|nr:RagB/SusD family nutrient uptake outer membrane protein [Bacteroidales bacterium OttesenSCG-928-J19]